MELNLRLVEVLIVAAEEGSMSRAASWLNPDGAPAVYGDEGRTPEECLQLVATGRGTWLAPASVAGYFSAPHLAWVPVADATPFELAVAWLRGRENMLLAAMIAHCRETAHSPGGEP